MRDRKARADIIAEIIVTLDAGYVCLAAHPAASGHAAEQRDELASARSSMGSPPEPALPAYRRLRMLRKRPQVFGAALNRSESSRGAGERAVLLDDERGHDVESARGI
jgi:hypothetical protein